MQNLGLEIKNRHWIEHWSRARVQILYSCFNLFTFINLHLNSPQSGCKCKRVCAPSRHISWVCIKHLTFRETLQYSEQSILLLTWSRNIPLLASDLAQRRGWRKEGGVQTRAWNEGCRRLREVIQLRRRPLIGTSPGWKYLLALSYLWHYLYRH